MARPKLQPESKPEPEPGLESGDGIDLGLRAAAPAAPAVEGEGERLQP